MTDRDVWERNKLLHDIYTRAYQNGEITRDRYEQKLAKLGYLPNEAKREIECRT